MAWLAVDKDESEWIFLEKPERYIDKYNNVWECRNGNYTQLEKGVIERLLDKKLTWDDEPVEI